MWKQKLNGLLQQLPTSHEEASVPERKLMDTEYRLGHTSSCEDSSPAHRVWFSINKCSVWVVYFPDGSGFVDVTAAPDAVPDEYVEAIARRAFPSANLALWNRGPIQGPQDTRVVGVYCLCVEDDTALIEDQATLTILDKWLPTMVEKFSPTEIFQLAIAAAQ